MTSPIYIYKILPATPPPSDPLPDALPISPLDRASGYIHLSTAAQVPATLRTFFTPMAGYMADHVYLLRVPYAHVEHETKWEDPAGEPERNSEAEPEAERVTKPGSNEGKLFPHLYRPDLKLGRSDVDAVGKWVVSEGGRWQIQGWPFELDSPDA